MTLPPTTPTTMTMTTTKMSPRSRPRSTTGTPLPRLNPDAAPYAGREALEAEVARRLATRSAPGDSVMGGAGAEAGAAAMVEGEGTEATLSGPVPLGAGAVQGALRAMFAKARHLDAEQARRQRFEQSIAPRMRAIGFPARYIRDLTAWNCPQQERTFRFCQERFTEIGAIVALVGERGVGKTFIAAQLCQQRIEAWFSYHERPVAERSSGAGASASAGAMVSEVAAETSAVNVDAAPAKAVPRGGGRYLKLTDLIARFKPLYADFGSTEIERLMAEREKLCAESLLCLDELHECEDQRLKSRVLTDILDRRYAARLDTLVISNEVESAFRETIGSSALSRITEHGEIVTCCWPSWRERGQGASNGAGGASGVAGPSGSADEGGLQS